MAEVWQEELEMTNLEDKVFNLYDQIKPLYMSLYAVVRHKLFQKYGSTIVDPRGPIPIHLRKYVGTRLVAVNKPVRFRKYKSKSTNQFNQEELDSNRHGKLNTCAIPV